MINEASMSTVKGEDVRDKIVQAVIQYLKEHGYPPTIREIGRMVDLKSTSSVQNHVTRLILEGRLETDAEAGSPRAIRVPGYQFVKMK